MPRIDKTPPYLQIAAQLRQEIKDGVYAPGTPVPTLRKLSEEWDVSQMTASKAVKELEKEGLVSIGGTGRSTLVTGSSFTALKAKAREAAKMLHQVASGAAVSADELHAMGDALAMLAVE
jgi:DNA-binding GntR family transcriptional regulator